jgi:chromosome segregation ATPase
MMDTAVMTTDLDKLAERVERAAALVTELRSRAAALEKEKEALQRVLDETRGTLQGQEPAAVVSELSTLRKEQREWQAERKDVASRIETILRKLDKIEV